MSKCAVRKLEVNDFAGLFGVSPAALPTEVKDLIGMLDFRYKTISPEDQEQIMLGVLKRVDSKQLSVSGKKRKKDWERGWAETLNNFVENMSDLDELTPKYLRPDQPARYNQGYIMPCDKKFELNFYTVFRKWLYRKYLKNASSIYEFGCGTGYNLVLIAEQYPHKKLYGLDWASSSVCLVNKISEFHGYDMTGIRFDMFHPREDLVVPERSIFLTMNSLEQIGNKHEQLIQFFIKKNPMLCVHSEPLVELYDENNLVDYLAVRYHIRRNYLNNYLTRLRELEREGAVKILKIHRVPFGSLYHEGYSLLIWKPLYKQCH